VNTLGTVIPVTGDPDGVREQAHALRDLAARIAEVEVLLADLRTSAVWESASGERFGTALAALPPVLGLLAERYRTAASALLSWVVDLRSAMVTTERAADDHLAARIELDEIERDLQLAAADPSTERYASLRSRQAVAFTRAQDAEDLCSRAWHRLHDAAEACAARLRLASADTLVDGAAFSAVRTSRSAVAGLTAALGAAALVPAPTQPFAAAGAAVGTGGLVGFDLLLLVGFGHGTAWDVTKSAGWAVAGPAAKSLARAAGAGAVRGEGGVLTGQHLATGERLRLAAQQARADARRHRDALRRPIADRSLYAPALGGTRPAATSTGAAREALHRRTLDMIEDRSMTAALKAKERWSKALINGRNAVVLQGGSEAITVARTTRSVHTKVTRAVDAAGRTQDRWQAWEEEKQNRRRP